MNTLQLSVLVYLLVINNSSTSVQYLQQVDMALGPCKQWLVILLISLLQVLVFAGKYQVSNGTQLECYLCDKQLEENTTLVLNHSVNYEVSHNRFCIVNTNRSITITSDSLEFATINCTHQNYSIPNSTFGLAFINTSVVLTRVVFHGCGATLPSSLGQSINSSVLHFSNIHAASILFIECSVMINEFKITYYYGFAFVAVNLEDSNFTKLYVYNSLGIELINKNVTNRSIGSGALIMFLNSSNNDPVITLFNCTFYGNNDLSGDKSNSCIASHFYDKKRESFTLVNAAALTIIFSQQISHPMINIKKSLFCHNIGTLAGAALILMFNTTNGSTEISGNSSFKYNSNLYPCYGSALVFYMIPERSLQKDFVYPSRIHSLKVVNSNFHDHSGLPGYLLNSSRPGYGAIYLGVLRPIISMDFTFRNVIFTNNRANKNGACMFATVYGRPSEVGRVGVTLENVQAYKNSQAIIRSSPSNTGMFTFNNIHHVIINGSSFSSNYGSVINTFSSPVYLYGNVVFKNNHAKSGAAVRLMESLLYFKEGLNATFYNNTAEEIGGAIYSESSIYNSYPTCVLQIPSHGNAVVHFHNNSARLSGNAIFATPIYNCYSMESNRILRSVQEYYEIFNFTNSIRNNLLSISSATYEFKLCENHTHKHKYSNHYPGETIHLNVTAVDGSGNHVYSVTSISLAEQNGMGEIVPSNSHVIPQEKFQILNESKSNCCSLLNVTIIFRDHFCSSSKYKKLLIFLSPFYSSDIQQFPITLINCPLGFALKEGKCQCNAAVLKFSKGYKYSANCDINTLTILRPSYVISPWLGNMKVNNSTIFGITGDCPLEHCNADLYLHSFKLINESFWLANSSNLSKHVPICLTNRNGVLCGTCTDSYSVVFGSSGCYKCSNKWLWTILLYAVAGPLLIYLLYALRLTLATGTLNGIIFYAQAANVGVLQLLLFYSNLYHKLYRFISIFLSFLNLNLGFPVCFYDGMTELWKTGLSLVFPIYLLTIVVVLIILSRYSTWLSNRISHSSVQVLVTVVHLSFSKLLITIIDVFTPATIYTSENPHYVWYKNGSIEYGKENGHVLLMAFTLIIVGALLIPYITILIGGRAFMKCSLGDKYLRPIYEAIHGPYREKKQYWFTARLFLLIVMYIIYTTFRGRDILLIGYISSPIIVIFVVLQAYIKPFKNKFLNILDILVMLNLILIYLIGLYFIVNLTTTDIWIYHEIIVTLVMILFIQFVLILVYHFLMVNGLLEKLKLKFARVKRYQVCNVLSYNSRRSLLSDINDSFYRSCHDYREPVIAFSNAKHE